MESFSALTPEFSTLKHSAFSPNHAAQLVRKFSEQNKDIRKGGGASCALRACPVGDFLSTPPLRREFTRGSCSQPPRKEKATPHSEPLNILMMMTRILQSESRRKGDENQVVQTAQGGRAFFLDVFARARGDDWVRMATDWTTAAPRGSAWYLSQIASEIPQKKPLLHFPDLF